MISDKKKSQLGMDPGTAQSQLKKSILFKLVQKCGDDICHHCKKKIETEDELSIEHKTPWLDSENPKELFFDLDNISFSHLSCNIKAARKNKTMTHGILSSYKKGCRCDVCREVKIKAVARQRANRKALTGKDR